MYCDSQDDGISGGFPTAGDQEPGDLPLIADQEQIFLGLLKIDCIPLLLGREGESFELQDKGQIAVPGESNTHRSICGIRLAAGIGLVSLQAGPFRQASYFSFFVFRFKARSSHLCMSRMFRERYQRPFAKTL